MNSYNNIPVNTNLGERYVVRSQLGVGKNSCVYLAVDLITKTDVAIKVLSPMLTQDEVALERFRREAEILRGLSHANIVRVYDFAEMVDFKIIVMEYFNGKSLKEKLREDGPMSIDAFLDFAKKVSECFHDCHQKGVIHRDIKPQNILVGANGDFKIVDFGVSRVNTMSDLTKTGTIIGTPEYMAPECFATSHVDSRADIYSLGVTFYEALAGHAPYRGQSLSQIMAEQMRGELMPLREARPEVPKWLEAVIVKMLQVLPHKRYQALSDLLEEFARKEKAKAERELLQTRIRCTHCNAEMFSDLAFCHQCGALTDSAFVEGQHSVVLYQTENPRELGLQILRLFPNTSQGRLQKVLISQPSLLVQGADEVTCQRLINQLTTHYCEIKAVKKLPVEIRLPNSFLPIVFLGLMPAFLTGISNTWKLTAVAAAEIFVFIQYKLKTRPLLRLKDVKNANSGKTESPILKYASKIKEIQDARAKEILGHLLRVSQMLLIDPNTATATKSIIHARLEDAFALGLGLDLTAAILKENRLPDLKKKLESVKQSMLQATSSAASEKQIQTKTQLQTDIRAIRLKQEEYANGYQTLLETLSTLRTNVADPRVGLRAG